MTYKPTRASVNAHPVPDWYEDAKFGIFIHWGLYSIPAFASRYGMISDVIRDRYDTAIAETPYTEWYCNAIKVPESESAKHHREVWRDAPYEDFREAFLKGLEHWSPEDWAAQFASAGARYVVLVTKHHDGYCLWPSGVTNPNRSRWTSARDIVGELAAAVRAKGMRFGVYYSGGIDWSFNPTPLRTFANFIGSVPKPPYADYAEAQVRELMARYRPSVLWNDISWPGDLKTELQLYADYYNTVDDGVVNDRWMPASWITSLLHSPLAQKILDVFAKRYVKTHKVEGVTPQLPPHCDFRTPEYTTFETAQTKKWEATRGMSHSFGYNMRDTDADMVSVETLVRGFIDTVSKNGNLLLNVGPRGSDAQIPEMQQARLRGFGEWIARNGDGIYGTRPWTRAEGRTGDGIAVRYTKKADALYAHLLGTPDATTVVLEGADLAALAVNQVTLLPDTAVTFEKVASGILLRLPASFPPGPAHCFRFSLDS